MACKDKQTGKNKTFSASLYHACEGIVTAIREEKNMKKHLLTTVVALLCGFIFQLSPSEWLWLILAIFGVIITEVINTTIENLVDLVVDYHYHPLAKKVKDMAAGVVLLASIFAAVIGCILFIPKLLQLL